MKQLKEIMQTILLDGIVSEDRTGVGTVSVFGIQQKWDLSEGFPATTSKKLAWKSVVSELLWFLEGSTNERRLAELRYGKPTYEIFDKKTIWTANADAQGKSLGYRNDCFIKELGPIYGSQWFDFEGFNQIDWLINEIKTNPSSRRLILTAWNPRRISEMALPPCHCFAQFYVRNNKLSCMMTQRSADVFLGSSFNIASYSLLTHIIARECGLDVGEFVYSIGDAHIYMNHLEQVKEYIDAPEHDLPVLEIDDSFKFVTRFEKKTPVYSLNEIDKFRLIDYKSEKSITAAMAV